MTTLLMLLTLTLLPSLCSATPAALASRHGSRLSVHFFDRILNKKEQATQHATCDVVKPSTLDICYWTGHDDAYEWLVSGAVDTSIEINLNTLQVSYFRQAGIRLVPGATRTAKFTLDPAKIRGIEIPDGTNQVRVEDAKLRERFWAIAQEADEHANKTSGR